MIPAEFAYLRPASVDEALQALHAHGEQARVLAGGQSLIPLLKLRLATPSCLIDLGHLRELSYIRTEGNMICIGALTTHAEVAQSELLHHGLPFLAAAAAVIGDVQVRNRGTIGGSLAHAHPAADLAAAVLAAEADLVIQSAEGRRTVPASEFFTGLFSTALRPDELLVEIRSAPVSGGAGSAYLKAEDPASHFAMVGVAAVVTVDAGRICTHARVAITGLTAVPFRARECEAALLGQPIDKQSVEAAAQRTVSATEPLSDLFASGSYRLHLAQVYTARAVLQAAGL